jgi:vacuolar-type H+-ATPase subunit E/Vma4
MRKIESLQRKQLLALKEKIVKHVVARVKEKFDALVAEAAFKDVLIEWTVEAALGLAEGDSILRVTASCMPLVDAAFLDKAARQYKELTGEDIAFTLAPQAVPKGHGIILESKNGKTAYSNLLENRLDRYEDTIQAIVLKDIFNE